MHFFLFYSKPKVHEQLFILLEAITNSTVRGGGGGGENARKISGTTEFLEYVDVLITF